MGLIEYNLLLQGLWDHPYGWFTRTLSLSLSQSVKGQPSKNWWLTHIEYPRVHVSLYPFWTSPSPHVLENLDATEASTSLITPFVDSAFPLNLLSLDELTCLGDRLVLFRFPLSYLCISPSEGKGGTDSIPSIMCPKLRRLLREGLPHAHKFPDPLI